MFRRGRPRQAKAGIAKYGFVLACPPC